MPRVDRAPGVLEGRASKMAQFAEATEIIVELADDDELRDAVVTLAVHAGIAAADVICLRRLGWYGQSANHIDAVGCLRQADAGAANHLAALLQLKTRAGYGYDAMSAGNVARDVRAMHHLVELARVA